MKVNHEDFLLASYHYELPVNSIAQYPTGNRDKSRLLVLRRGKEKLSHHRFPELARFLEKGDCLVLNNTRVFPARLLGRKSTGGKIEVFLLNFPQKEAGNTYIVKALCKSSKSPRTGQLIEISERLKIEILKRENGKYLTRLIPSGELLEILKESGKVPLPPYIRRQEEPIDKSRYQTVYAKDIGSVAAPTAGLHFSKGLLSRLKEKGVKLAPLTLHVGYGTFSPVRCEDIRKHKLHGEWISIGRETAEKINETRMTGGRILCVGTTSVRTVEFVHKKFGTLREYSGICDLYIYPGFNFQVTDMLLTNFHLPKSSLLILVSAFAGRRTILKAYQEALKRGYRFFSYGDAMLIT